MSFNTSEVLSDSLYRAFSRNGVIVMIGVYLASLVGSIGYSSIFIDTFNTFWDEFTQEQPQFADLFDDPEMFFPLAFDIPEALALLLIAVSIVASVVLLAVAIRVFHAGIDDELPTELVFDNIAWVGVNLFVGGIIFGLLWLIGLIFFIVPGIFVFVLLVYFSAATAVEDRNFVDAFARSVSVTKGERLQIFLLFLAFFLVMIAVGIAFSIVGSFFILVSPALSSLIDLAAQTIIVVYFAAVVAVSYRALNEPDDTAEDAVEEDPFEEFTPASEGTQ